MYKNIVDVFGQDLLFTGNSVFCEYYNFCFLFFNV